MGYKREEMEGNAIFSSRRNDGAYKKSTHNNINSMVASKSSVIMRTVNILMDADWLFDCLLSRNRQTKCLVHAYWKVDKLYYLVIISL